MPAVRIAKKESKNRGFKRQARKNAARAKRNGYKAWMALAPHARQGHDKSRSGNHGRPPTFSDKPARR